jgi:hypothetical protein
MDILQPLVSLVGGGLAGGCLTIVFNLFTSRQLAKAKQSATVAALIGELRLAKDICDANGRQETYIHVPTLVATRVTFSEREVYPLLKDVQPDLEQYVLTASWVNEMIDTVRTVLLQPGAAVAMNLHSQIRGISTGETKATRVASTDSIALLELIDALISRLSKTEGR